MNRLLFASLITAALLAACSRGSQQPVGGGEGSGQQTSGGSPEPGSGALVAEPRTDAPVVPNEQPPGEPGANSGSAPGIENPGGGTAPVVGPGPLPSSATRPDVLLARIPAGAALVLLADGAALIAAAENPGWNFLAGAGNDAALVRRQLDELGRREEIVAGLGQAVRLSQARQIVVAVYAGGDDEGVLVVANPEVLAEPPADGAAPVLQGAQGARVAVRDGLAYFGVGSPLDRALAISGGDGAFDPATAWSDGWSALPATSAVTVLAPDWRAVPDELRRELPRLERMGASRLAFSLSLDGSARLLVDAVSADPLSHGLGTVQREAIRQIDEWSSTLPPAQQGWSRYARLVLDALASRIQVRAEGSPVTIDVRPVSCGTPMKALLPLAFVFGVLADDATRFDSQPWRNVEQPVEEGCTVVEGPAPRIPRSLVRIGTADPGTGAVFVLFDLAALLRQSLPTVLGLLPISLPTPDLIEALGPQPLGLNGLADAEGSGMFYFEQPQSGRSRSLLIAPNGFAELMPPSSGSPGETSGIVPELGYTIGNSELVSRTQSMGTGGAWSDVTQALPGDTLLGIVGNRAIARPLVEQIPGEPNGLTRALLAAETFSIALSRDWELTGALRTPAQAAELAPLAEEDLRAMLRSAMARQGPSGDPEAERLYQGSVEGILGELRMEALDADHIRIEFGNTGTFVLFGAGAALAVPLLVGSLEPPSPEAPVAPPQ